MSYAPAPFETPPRPAERVRPTPIAIRIALVVGVAPALIASAILVVGQLAPGGDKVKIALAVAWLLGLGLILGKAVKGKPDLRVPMRIATVGAGVLVLGWYANSLRGKDVQDELVAPAPAAQTQETVPADSVGAQLLASGGFAALDHEGRGRAEVVRMSDKLILQLRDFQTDAGPDLRLYLSTDDQASDFVDLGGLKGNSGNQVYEIPAGTDTKKYGTVLVWCRAFSVPFTAAELG